MQYKKFRNAYKPESIRAVFVLESPPKSGKFFYNPKGETTEPLFKAMMDLIDHTPVSKKDGLEEFKQHGFIIIDAIYTPINDMKEGKGRDDRIMGEHKVLLKDLSSLVPDKRPPLILVKKNVCLLLEKPLKENGFIVANDGIVVYFPSHSQQGKFQEQIALVLKNSGIRVSQK